MIAAIREVSALLRNAVYYDVHDRPTPVLTLSQLNPFHTLPPYFLNICLILTSRLRLGLPSSPSFRFSNQNSVRISHLSHEYYMFRPSHTPWVDDPNNIWWSLHIMEFIPVQTYPVSSHFIHFKTFSLPPCPQTSLIHILSLMWEIRFMLSTHFSSAPLTIVHLLTITPCIITYAIICCEDTQQIWKLKIKTISIFGVVLK
jgi:hypothetical protein